MRFKILSLVFLSIALTACQQTGEIKSVFNAKEASYILKKGDAKIEGEAFLRRDLGRIVTGAGEKVFLVPATSYTLERFDLMFRGSKRAYSGIAIEDTPSDYYTYRRDTKMDMSGKFVFENVAPGRYIVATRVVWTESEGYITFPQGGAVYDVITVEPGETAKVILSGN